MKKILLAFAFMSILVFVIFLSTNTGSKANQKVLSSDLSENFTISDMLKAYSTEQDFVAMMNKLDETSDATFVEATYNNGKQGGYIMAQKKAHKLMMQSMDGSVKYYADDAKGATIKQIKVALNRRDKEFAAGKLVRTVANNFTLFDSQKRYKNLAAFDKVVQAQGWTDKTMIERLPEGGYTVCDKTVKLANYGSYNASKDSNAATVAQIRAVLKK